MWSAASLVLVLVALILRPQDLFAPLFGRPLVWLTLVIAGVALALGVRRRSLRWPLPPTLLPAGAFLGWLVVVTAIVGGGARPGDLATPLLLASLLGVFALGMPTFRALHLVAGVLLACGLVIGGLLVAQRLGPVECVRATSTPLGLAPTGVPCGLPGETALCGPPGSPGADDLCAHVGPLGLTSVGPRVRYVGLLQDPNEVSVLLCGLLLPIALALYELHRSTRAAVLLGATSWLILSVTLLSQSRTGKLVAFATLAAYVVLKLGPRLLALFVALGLPVLFLRGTRFQAEATGSTNERLELMYMSMSLAKQRALTGIGFGRIEDHLHMTAHSTWALVAVELGLPGLFLLLLVFVTTASLLWSGVVSYRDRPDARTAYVWCRAMLASLAGTLVGVSFLSYAYKPILWMQLGMYAAVLACVRAADPGVTLRVRPRLVAWTLAATLAVWAGMYFMTRWMPPGSWGP